MNKADVYRITDRLDDASLEAIAARLEVRGQHPRFMAMLNEYLDAMALHPSARVLDLGCGTGVASREVARRPGFAGRVLGIDRSAYLVAAARKRALEEGLSAWLEFEMGDSRSLALANGSFDAAIAHTLLSHVEDPLAVLREMARVVRPGGVIGIFDGDYASMTFAGADAASAQRTDAAIIEAIATSPRAMRDMPQLLAEAGLQLQCAFGHVMADIGRADYFAGTISSFVRLLPRAGAMTQSEVQQWADDMLARSARGAFFGATNFYSYVARRP
jgi:ubiquinone/menaquinone biosynthesis C-methylase UbiE